MGVDVEQISKPVTHVIFIEYQGVLTENFARALRKANFPSLRSENLKQYHCGLNQVFKGNTKPHRLPN